MAIRPSDGFSMFRNELNAQAADLSGVKIDVETPSLGHIWWKEVGGVQGQIVALDTPAKVATAAGPDQINVGANTNNFSYLNGTLTYIYEKPRFFSILVNVSSLSFVPGTDYYILLKKNGVEINDSRVYGTTGADSKDYWICSQTVVYLEAGDTIDLWVESPGSTNDITIEGCQLIIM